MKVGYVVLYCQDAEAARRFWIDQVGMIEKQRAEAAGHVIAKVGFAGQDFAFELVPLALMADNPHGLDLTTPSICFSVADLEATRAQLLQGGVQVSEIGEHSGVRSFAFADPEGHWFAVACS